MKIFLLAFSAMVSIHARYLGFLQKLAARLSTRSSMQRQKGVTAMEYVLIIAVIVIVIISVIYGSGFSTKIKGLFTNLGSTISKATLSSGS